MSFFLKTCPITEFPDGLANGFHPNDLHVPRDRQMLCDPPEVLGEKARRSSSANCHAQHTPHIFSCHTSKKQLMG